MMNFLRGLGLLVPFALFALVVVGEPSWSQQVRGTPAWRTAQVSVAVTATLVATNNPNRSRVMVITTGTNQVYCGPDNTVTALTGIPIAPTAFSNISIDTIAPVWCIAASTQTVAVAESY